MPMSEAPEGVVLIVGRREIPCTVRREPARDRDGNAYWVAVPDEPVTLRPGQDPELRIAVMPARTELGLDVPIAPPRAN
jgi:hypothetical protein